MRELTLLHTKGVFTLSLLLLAESITFTNAVSFWNNFNRQQRGQHAHAHAHPNPSGNVPVGSNMAGSASGGPGVPASMTGTAARTSTCSASSSSPSLAQKACLSPPVPRGGHQHQIHDHLHSASAAATDSLVPATPYGLPMYTWKVIFQAFLTAMNVFCWLVPLRSKKISQNKYALSLANAFSGGVFLSLAFGHLIPECVHGFIALQDKQAAAAAASSSSFTVWPVETPFLIVLAGYLLIFFVEKVAFDAHEILHEMQEHGSVDTDAIDEPQHDDRGHSHSHHGHSHSHDRKKSTKEMNGVAKHQQPKAAPAVTPPASSGRGAVILLGALAVHSILEMMALGLTDSFADAALLTLSIALHQPAESIALLVAFIKSGMPQAQIIQYLSIFSCMGPLGVALGMAVNEYAAPIVDTIMLAVVAGTFVYVGATEVIPEEWEDPTHKWPKFAALMTGIISILVITQYTAQFHTH